MIPVQKPKAGPTSKLLLLSFMASQNALLNVFARWSRVEALSSAGTGAAKSSMVATVELVKIVVALLLLCIEQSSVKEALVLTAKTTTTQRLETAKLCVPSLLYVIQNNLLLVGADNLEGPVQAVISQTKIFTTAAFSVLILKKQLGMHQWTSLVILAAGVSLVQVSLASKSEGDMGSRNVYLGVVAVLASTCTSGLAGVYFEAVLKGTDISIWIRNIHMACIGCAIAVAGAFMGEPELVQKHGFFGGYTPVTWGLVICQSLGGLLVAAVVKYTDNILKGFASAAGILGTCLASMVYFNFCPQPLFYVGGACVVFSIFLYADMLSQFRYCQCSAWLGCCHGEKPSEPWLLVLGGDEEEAGSCSLGSVSPSTGFLQKPESLMK